MMVCLTVTACPEQLRGYLTRWLMEVSTGVYVGNVNHRVRDEIWEMVRHYSHTGRAVLAFPDHQCEQGFSVRCHNTVWQPVDHGGVSLMLHPVDADKPAQKAGWSKAARFRAGRRFGNI